MISSRGRFPFECHEAGTNLSARKTGFYFFFFLLMEDAFFFFSLWKSYESCKTSGSASRQRRPGEMLLPALGQGSEGPGQLRGEWPQVQGPPRASAEGSWVQTNPLSSERPVSDASCLADVTTADAAAAGDSRRAGEPSSPVAGSPPAPYLPCAFPGELTRRERQRQPGSLLQQNAKGRTPGATARLLELLWAGFRHRDSSHHVHARSQGDGTIRGHTDPSQPSSSLP